MEYLNLGLGTCIYVYIISELMIVTVTIHHPYVSIDKSTIVDVSIRLEEPFELFLEASAPWLSRLLWDCTIWPLRREFHYIKLE